MTPKCQRRLERSYSWPASIEDTPVLPALWANQPAHVREINCSLFVKLFIRSARQVAFPSLKEQPLDMFRAVWNERCQIKLSLLGWNGNQGQNICL
jgi:hypothetical protein